MYQDLSKRHDWPVQNAIVNLPIRLKENLKHISGNLLSLLGAQNKYIGAASQTLLTGVSLRCGIGTDFLLLPPYPGLSKVSGCRRKLPPTWLVLAGYPGWHFFTLNKISLNWLLTLTSQPSISNLSGNPVYPAKPLNIHNINQWQKSMQCVIVISFFK